MCDYSEIIKNPELLYLASVKRMAVRIDTSIENTKTVCQDSLEGDKFLFTDTTSSSFRSSPNHRPNIIHFFGSSQDDFYNGVSLYYMRGAYENLIERESSPVSRSYNHILVQCHPNGTWSFPTTLSDNDLHAAARVSIGTMISMIDLLKPVAAAPHMFCTHGLTTVRGLFEMLGVPVIGNKSELMALSTNKWQTRCILESSGVPVPKAKLLTTAEVEGFLATPSMTAPFIIKPCSEGNSLGLSMFKGGKKDELSAMIGYAFKYDTEVLVEEYIPLGYEVRAAVVENEKGDLEVLPICNYVLQDSHPIRTLEDKLETNKDGVPTTATKCKRELPPKSLPVEVICNIEKYAKKAHTALGCRDYSIFDVRVSPEGIPYFIEASLYCSYASKSIIVMMSEAEGRKPYDLFTIALEKAINRCPQKREDENQNCSHIVEKRSVS